MTDTQKEIALISIMAMLMALLGLWHLDFQSIWLDEYTTMKSSQSLKEIIAYCKDFPEQHPLYYLLVLMLSGYKSLYGLRLISLIFGVAAIFPLYIISKKLISARVANLTCLFYSISPFILYYNQEGRMYTLLMFFAMMQIASFVFWIIENRKGSLLGFITFSTLGLYTHFFFLLILFSEVVYIIYLSLNKKASIKFKNAIIAFGIIGLSYTPWLIFMITHLGQNAQSWKGLKHILFAPLYTIFRFIYGYAVFPLNVQIKMNMYHYMLPFVLISLVMIVFLVPTLILWRKTRIFEGKALLVPILAFLPICLMIIGSFVKNVISQRYIIYSAPFIFMVISAIAVNNARKNKILATFAYLLPICLSLFGLFQYYNNSAFGKMNAKAAAQYIREAGPDESMVVCYPAFIIQGCLDYYLKGSKRLVPYEKALTELKEKKVWVLETIFKLGPPADLSGYGYRKVNDKIWPQENGLRLSLWMRQKIS